MHRHRRGPQGGPPGPGHGSTPCGQARLRHPDYLRERRQGSHQAALYARAAQRHRAQTGDALDDGLRAALRALHRLLPDLKPRLVPFRNASRRPAILYADAFYLDGERRHKAGFVPSTARASQRDRQRNGWGFVLTIDDEVFYDYAEVPADVLAAFVTRRA